MSKLLQKPATGAQRHNITPASAGWEHVGFAQYALQAEEQLSCHQDGRELCLVILTARPHVQVGVQSW